MGKRFLLFAVFAGVLACVISATSGDAAGAVTKLSSRTGVVMTPRNFPNQNGDDIADMFRLDAELGSFAVLRIDWKDPQRLEVMRVLSQLSQQRNLATVIELNPLKADGLKGATLELPKDVSGPASFATPAVAEAFGKAVLDLAQLKPAYLALATDVNLLAASDPRSYAALADAYARLYPRIKQISPDTKVFVTFNWDAARGKDRNATRSLVEAFRPLDVLAFGSNPQQLFDAKGPSAIPVDYFAGIAELRARSVPVYLEVSWPSDGRKGDSDQAAFIRALPELTASLNPSMLAWSFLHDVRVMVFTVRSGLIDADGKQKPAFAAFREIGDDRPLAAASGASVAASSRAAAPKVSVASREPAQFGIYTARLDGGGVQTIITNPTQEMTHPRLSPDNTRLVFTRYNKRGKDGNATEEQGYEETEILVVNVDGTGLETIIPPKPGVIAANGAWTPDAKALIFISTDNPQRAPEIRQIDLATRAITRVPTPAGMKTTDPHWLGKEIVFPVKGDGADSLWIMNADGSGAQQITKPARPFGASAKELYGDFDPKLSPDGSKVAFMRIYGGATWRVMLLDRKTGAEQLLSPKDTIEGLPTWSSDGSLLLFVHLDLKRPQESGLYTMKPDGSGRRKLPLPPGFMYNHGTFFSGDGSSDKARIIFAGKRVAGM